MRDITITIDSAETQEMLRKMQNAMSDEGFERAMYGIMNRTGGHVRMVLRKDLPHDYHVKAGDINRAVGKGKVGVSFGGIGCIIPVTAERGTIGNPKGKYKARGGAKGWDPVTRGVKYRITAKIVKAGVSTLPEKMKGYGNQPPFRNYKAKKLNGLTFTRATKKRYPLMKVVGIALPQMPATRSEPEVQEDIGEYMQERIERRFMALMKNGK